jgi:hypothetical protein
LLSVAVLCGAAALAGCPIYSNQDYRVCTGGTCYDCPDPNYSDMCVPWACSTDSDCGGSLSCTSDGLCGAPSQDFDAGGSGDDATLPNDCSLAGNECPSGQRCVLKGGAASCQPIPPSGSGSGDASDDVASLDATAPTSDAPSEAMVSSDSAPEGAPVDSASPEASWSDAPPDSPLVSEAGLPEASASIACNANGDCSVGAYCVDGQCVPQSQLCSDGSQCAVAGESCVDGFCVPTCSSSAPCPTGFQCNVTLGVCITASPCTGGSTSSCVGGTVCVETHCVPPCSDAEGGAACPSGQVCVNGGCLPDQKATFTCRNDGSSGQLANTCDPSSVCLHHACYTACDGDGGGCPASQCKQVTVHAGTYAVCGTATTLGSQCDLATGSACSSGTCVDGYCK